MNRRPYGSYGYGVYNPTGYRTMQSGAGHTWIGGVRDANMSSASHMMGRSTYHPIGGNPMPQLIRPGDQWGGLGRSARRAGRKTVQEVKQGWDNRLEAKAQARTEAMGQHPAAQNLYASPVFGAGPAKTVGTPGSYYQAPDSMGARRPAPEVATVNPLMPDDTLYTAPKMMGVASPASRMAKFAQGRGLGQ